MHVARLPHRIEVCIPSSKVSPVPVQNPRCRAAYHLAAEQVNVVYHLAAYQVAAYPQRRATSGCTLVARRRRYLAAVGGRRFGVRDGTGCAGFFVVRQPERSAALDAFARDGAQVAAGDVALIIDGACFILFRSLFHRWRGGGGTMEERAKGGRGRGERGSRGGREGVEGGSRGSERG